MSGPIPRSYRVGEWPLYAGAYPGSDDGAEADANVAAICGAGVDLFFDLTEFGELEPYAHLLPRGVEHRRFPLARREDIHDLARRGPVGHVEPRLER